MSPDEELAAMRKRAEAAEKERDKAVIALAAALGKVVQLRVQLMRTQCGSAVMRAKVAARRLRIR